MVFSFHTYDFFLIPQIGHVEKCSVAHAVRIIPGNVCFQKWISCSRSAGRGNGGICGQTADEYGTRSHHNYCMSGGTPGPMYRAGSARGCPSPSDTRLGHAAPPGTAPHRTAPNCTAGPSSRNKRKTTALKWASSSITLQPNHGGQRVF